LTEKFSQALQSCFELSAIHPFFINSAFRNPKSLPTGRQGHLKWANFFVDGIPFG
jgi:hypothetical protein